MKQRIIKACKDNGFNINEVKKISKEYYVVEIYNCFVGMTYLNGFYKDISCRHLAISYSIKNQYSLNINIHFDNNDKRLDDV